MSDFDFSLFDEEKDTEDAGPVVSEDGSLPLETQVQAELSDVLEGFKSRAKREEERFNDATDSEYWVAICFQSREQKEEFLNKLDLIDLGDKYLDGMEVARKLGLKLQTEVLPVRKTRPFDMEFVNIAMDL